MHRDDMRVLNGRSRPGLPDEPLTKARIGRQGRRHDFQCHPTAQPLIHGTEHHGHPACAKLLLNAVAGHA